MRKPEASLCRSCGSDQLVKAHIVPAAIGRLVKGSGTNIKQISLETRPPLQSGIWDRQILCGQCDQCLGSLDKYAVEFFRRLKKTPNQPAGSLFRVTNVDTSKVEKFVMSVLWRASITTRSEFSAVRLGPYEDKFKELLFSAKSISYNSYFEVVIFRYFSEKIPVSKFYTMPIFSFEGNANCYVFGMGGTRIMAKVDRRPFSAPYRPFAISGKTHIEGLVIRLEDTPEFKEMSAVVRDRIVTRSRGR